MSTKYDMAANSLIINKLTYAQYKAGRADGSISDDQVNNEIFDITDIDDLALFTDIPTNTSQLNNDSEYVTINSDITGTAANANTLDNEEPAYYLDYANFTGAPTSNTAFTNGMGYITSSDNITGTATNASKLNNESPEYYLDYTNFTNIPTELPADGGNADTINNLSSSSFIRSDIADSADGYITMNAGATIKNNLIVTGDLTVSGTNTIINTTTVSTTDNLIQLATDNTVALLGYAGIYVNKYDGTHTGALVFDATGTAYVGDVTDNGDGTISAISGDSSSSSLQPLATRNKVIADGSLLQ